jgi:hypothetical protein
VVWLFQVSGLIFLITWNLKDISVHKYKRRLLAGFLIVLFFGTMIVYAPCFLIYSSNYRKADAIILFLGPDFTARQKEAYKMIKEEISDYLIIPAYHKIYKIVDGKPIKYYSPNSSSVDSVYKKSLVTPFPYFYEDTHIEIIEARKIMSDYGLKSAIFVSSPYHMRRIKVIVTRVFNSDESNFYFVPTSFEKAPRYFWELSWTDWRKVGREYGKMLWFTVYGLWTE